MHTIDPGESFKSWRDAARRILAAGIPPAEILWEKEPNLFAGLAEEPAVYGGPSNTSHPVPKPFIGLARNASCHREPTRWSLLYRILWRLTHGEPRLLSNPADPDVARARNLEKNVHREIHKMHAFVRFRKDGENHDGRERFTAWFEPEHFIVEAASPFFRKRFANMDWSIFTPKGC
ncbi:MAG: TIGR03915 family putative DNA repair protein, partial [Verrucomicrobiota bacterium]